MGPNPSGWGGEKGENVAPAVRRIDTTPQDAFFPRPPRPGCAPTARPLRFFALAAPLWWAARPWVCGRGLCGCVSRRHRGPTVGDPQCAHPAAAAHTTRRAPTAHTHTQIPSQSLFGRRALDWSHAPAPYSRPASIPQASPSPTKKKKKKRCRSAPKPPSVASSNPSTPLLHPHKPWRVATTHL